MRTRPQPPRTRPQMLDASLPSQRFLPRRFVFMPPVERWARDYRKGERVTDKCATPYCRRPTILTLPNGTEMSGPCNAVRLNLMERKTTLTLKASLHTRTGHSTPSSFSDSAVFKGAAR